MASGVIGEHQGTLRVSLRGTGIAMALSGLVLMALVPLHPTILGDRKIAAVVLDTGSWRAIHVGLALSSVLGLFGAVGIVAAHGGRLGRLGQHALVATIVGTITTACVAYIEATTFPVIAGTAPGLLDFDGPILGSVLLRAMAAPALGYPLGFAALGVAAARVGVHQRAGRALMATALGFAAFEGLFVPVLGVLSTVAFSAAQVWWGWLLWQADASSLEAPRPRSEQRLPPGRSAAGA